MKKDLEYYLSIGMDYKTATYFATGRRTIKAVYPNDDFTLTIHFDNGEIRLLEMKDAIQPGTVFEVLEDINVFRRVYLDEQHTISWDKDPTVDSNEVWDNKIDICPDFSYINSVPINPDT